MLNVMGRLSAVIAGAVLGAGLSACSSDSPPQRSSDVLAEVLAEATERNASPNASSMVGGLPATFVGVVPCPDCRGIRLQLNLYDNLTFRLRAAELGKADAPRDAMGTWTLGDDRRTLTLRTGRQATRRFAIRDDRTLRELDVTGREMGGGDGHDLTRSARFEPFEARLSVEGLYVYMADAGMFTECLTRERWPVAMEAANAELERAYLNVRPTPGAEVFVAIEGRLAMRPPMEGTGERETLVVDRVVGAWANRSCESRGAGASLERTTWKLTHLGRELVDTSGMPLEPTLELRPGSFEFFGSDGCNRVVGVYELEAARLRFRIGAVTRIGCPDGNSVSRAFSDALGAAEAWQLVGDELELLDGRGRVLARLSPR